MPVSRFPANELWSRSLLPLISKSLFWRRKKRPLRPAMFAISFSVTWRRRIFPFILSGVSLITEGDHKLCGGIQRGACAPLCVVVGEGFIREGPHRKGPSLMRFFGHFLSAQKVTRGMGPGRPHTPGIRGRSPRKLSNRMAVTGEEKCFSPTRPAMGESMRIGALRWHRAI